MTSFFMQTYTPVQSASNVSGIELVQMIASDMEKEIKHLKELLMVGLLHVVWSVCVYLSMHTSVWMDVSTTFYKRLANQLSEKVYVS